MSFDDLKRGIRQRDVGLIARLMFEGRPPSVRAGYRTEMELFDYKRDCPRPGIERATEWAEVAKDALAFHNQQGGVLVFGITNDFGFCGASTRLDSKLANDALRKYLGDRIWVDFHREFIQEDQRYLGIMVIPPRGPALARFQGDAPEINGRKVFRAGDTAVREGDCSTVLRGVDADAYARRLAIPALGKTYEVDEPFFRILAPDYSSFIERQELCCIVERALRDPRTAVTSLLGIGGVGKTALATWACLRAYEAKAFELIVSTTAKDRELTRAGIQALQPGFTSFETLLDAICDVLQFPDLKGEPIEVREQKVRELLRNSRGLLYVDNLETVDDKRIISFLDDLPGGLRAITTSRRGTVRVAMRPVEVGQFSREEVVEYIASLSAAAGMAYVRGFTEVESLRIGDACDRIPLAIKWALARSKSAAEALATADSITQTGRRGEELLEFSFRRVFDTMTEYEKAIVQVLSLYTTPLPTEHVLVGAGVHVGLTDPRLTDAIEQLVDDALVQRVFDPNKNDYCYTLLPITRAFVYAQVIRDPTTETGIRQHLSDWFEARDVRDRDERLVIRASRQGRGDPEIALLDLGIGAEKRGDIDAAERLYEQALQRNSKSWRAAKLLAELRRHRRQNITDALRLYDQAAANAPRAGIDRALIFRERGILLAQAGTPDATERAIDSLEVAHEVAPNDAIAAHALGNMLVRAGRYRRAIAILEPLVESNQQRTRDMAVTTLIKAYEATGEIVKLAEAKEKARKLGILPRAGGP